MSDTPTRADRTDKLAALPEPQAGYERRWKHCRTHDRYGFYDFVPYSLSNPIAVMPCGCDAKICNAVSKAEVVATERIAGLEGEVERLRRNVRGWVEWHRRCDADDDCTYLNDNAWCDAEALASTGMGLLARTALKGTDNDPA